MGWLYVVAFVLGIVYTTAGSAAQIVLTQVVSRDRLVEAHAKNALASSGAEVAGPGVAGVLIKLLGAPLALAVDACLVLTSALILRGIRIKEELNVHPEARFWRDLKAGLQFVRERALLVALASAVGGWQFCNNAAQVVQILYATRSLGLTGQSVGLCYVALGAGTVMASIFGHRISRRFGPGPSLLMGIGFSGLGWFVLALAPLGPLGVAAFALMLFSFGVGAVLIFINFLALRQAVTPAPMLGRMTSTMRWLILLPAGPGALIGGWLGEHVSLRASLLLAGTGAVGLALVVWRLPVIRQVRELPKAPGTPQAPGAPQAPNTPAASNALQASNMPEAPVTPVAPVAPDATLGPTAIEPAGELVKA